MTTTFSTVLKNGPLYRGTDGIIHVSRNSESDCACKLLNGNINEFGLLSAIREVADVEQAEGFVASPAAYMKVVALLMSMAGTTEDGFSDSEFARHYREVARLVTEYANSLNVEVAA